MQRSHRRNIRQLLEGLVERKVHLPDAKRDICNKLNKSYLECNQENYIETKYIKLCLKKLEIEIENFIPQSNNQGTLQDFTQEIRASHKFTDLPKQIQQSAHFELIINALKIRPQNENEVLSSLKSFVTSTIIRLSPELNIQKNEHSEFYQNLVAFLTHYKTQFIQNLSVDLIFENNFDKFVYDKKWEEVNTFPEEAVAINEKYKELIEKLKATKIPTDPTKAEIKQKLEAQFFDQVSISVRKDGEKQVLVVSRKILTLSKCLDKIQTYLSEHPSVEEVELNAIHIYFDESLENFIWHGKNLLLLSQTVDFPLKNTVIDVSGLDGENGATSEIMDGLEPGEDGKNGQHASPGESGGNVTLISDQFENLQNLTIFSNGGNGGTGQNGGDGVEGLDGSQGSEISLSTLKSDYPTSVFLTKNKKQMEKTISKILNSNPKIESQELSGFSKDGIMIDQGFFPRRHFYLKGTFPNGVKVEYCFSQWGRGRCAYLLFQGAKGSVNYGGMGGLGGRLGEGGYPGSVQFYSPTGTDQEIDTTQVTLRREKGSDGEPGKDGKSGSNGKPGRNGKDVGFLDYYTWKGPVYKSEKHFKLISKKDHPNFPSKDEVWCSKHSDYRTIVECSEEASQGQVTNLRQNQKNVESSVAIQATRKNDVDVQQAFEKVQIIISKASINSNETQLNMGQVLGDLAKQQNSEMKITKNSIRSATKLSSVKPTPEWRKIRMSSKSGKEVKMKMPTVQKPTFRKIWRVLSQPENPKMELELSPKTRNANLLADESPPADYNGLEKKERKDKLEEVRKEIPLLFEDYPNLIQDCLKSFMDDVKNANTPTDEFQEKFSHLICLFEKFKKDGEESLRSLDKERAIKCFKEYTRFLKKTEIILVAADLALLETIDKHFYQMNSEIFKKLEENYSSKYFENYDELESNLNSFLEASRGKKVERNWTPLELHIISNIFPKSKSDEELESVIHFALEIYGHARETYSTYRLSILGIMASYPVQDWAPQITQVAIEMYFGKLKENKEDYTPNLSKLPSQLLIKIANLLRAGSEFSSKDQQKFDHFLKKILSYEPKSCWNYALLDNLHTCSLWCHQLTKMQVESELNELTTEIWDNTNNNKMEAFYYLHNLFESQPTKIKIFMKAYQVKSREEKEESPNKTTKILSNFHSGFWDLSEDSIQILRSSPTISGWFSLQTEKKSSKIQRKLGELVHVIRSDPKENTIVISQKGLIHNIKEWLELDSKSEEVPISEWLEEFRTKLKEIEDDEVPPPKKSSKNALLVQALNKVDSVIKQELGYHLRHTQKIAILAALSCDDSTSASTAITKLLSQVKTGEGKSCIVLSVAIIRGIFGKKTDVVTSNSILAQRDAHSYKKIYDMFQLTVGEVTMNNPEERKREYLKMVVYGEVSNFQRDYLLDRFYNTNNRGNRGFSDISVIIDEVDSMFLDKGNSVLYLSHTPPDLNTLETIFLFVWNRVLAQVNGNSFNPGEVYVATMDAIFPRLTLSHLNELVDDSRNLFKFLVDNEVIMSNGRFKKLEFTLDDQDFPGIQAELNLLIRRMLSQGPPLPVMSYLHDFVEFHLPTWIKSAFQATKMCDGVEYVIDFDRTSFQKETEAKVIVLDMDTGVDMKDSQWTGGLHQFLQLKHGCRLTPLSLKAVFISNISFFKLYRNIFGLTGTLGTEVDRVFLEQTYDAKFLVIPTAAPRDFKEEVPIVCWTRERWFDEVGKEVEHILLERRSTLIICETVRDVQNLHNYLSRLDFIKNYSLEMYRRDFEPFECAIGNNGLEPGKVIIATNLAGRGTDINLTKPLRENRGLHVIFAYLPNNKRVWWQGFGRASRCGDPGSGRLIFTANSFVLESMREDNESKSSITMAINYMLKNDEMEMSRVADICEYYKRIIKPEEVAFQKFHNLYKTFSEKLQPKRGMLRSLVQKVLSQEKDNEAAPPPIPSGYSKEVQDILKENLLDDWAFWLDKYSDELSKEYNNTNSRKKTTSLEGEVPDFEKFKKYTDFEEVEDYIKKAIEVVDEPAHLIKLGLFYTNEGKFEDGNKFFDKVILNGEHFSSTIAKYYKLFSKLKNPKIRTNSKNVLENELVQEIKLVAEELGHFKSTQLAIFSAVSRNVMVGKQNLIITDGLKNQKQAVAEILHQFQNSLQTFLMREVTEEKFYSVCGNPLAAKIAFKEMLKKELICSPRISKKIKRNSGEKNMKLSLSSLTKIYPISLDKLERSLTTVKNTEDLKNSLGLPSASGFWKKLNFSQDQILTFGVIQKLKPDLDLDKQNDLVSPNDIVKACWKKAEHLFENGKQAHIMYACKKNTSLSNCDYKIIPGSRKELLQNPQFLSYKHGKMAYIDEIAVLDLPFIKKVKLTEYHKISKDAFVQIEGIDQTKSEIIFKNLQDSKIIDENGELLSLELSKWANNLPKPLRSFKSDIVSTIIGKCAYKYQLLSFQANLQNLANQKHSGFPDNNNNTFPQLFLNLPKNLFRRFLSDANDLNLISKCMVNSRNFERLVEKVSSKETITLDKKTFQKIFSKVGHTDQLIDSYWRELASLKTIKILAKYYSIENSGSEQGPSKITLKMIQQSDPEKKDLLLPESEYSSTLKYVRDTISFELQKEHILSKCKHFLAQFSSCFLFYDKTQVDLVDIGDALQTPDSRYNDLLPSFYLSGIHYVISFQEGKYSTKMILSASAVLTLGILQVAAAVALPILVGPQFAIFSQQLATSGVLDIIFAARAFYYGTFSWQSYAAYKTIQVAINVCLPMFPFAAEMEIAVTTASKATAVATASTPTTADMTVNMLQTTITSMAITKGIALGAQQVVELLSKSISSVLARIVTYLKDDLVKLIETDKGFDGALGRLSSVGKEKGNTVLMDFSQQTFNDKLHTECLSHTLAHMANKLFQEGLKPALEEHNLLGEFSEAIAIGLEAVVSIANGMAETVKISGVAKKSLGRISKLINRSIQEEEKRNEGVVLELRQAFTGFVVEKYAAAFQQHIFDNLMAKSMNNVMSNFQDMTESYNRSGLYEGLRETQVDFSKEGSEENSEGSSSLEVPADWDRVKKSMTFQEEDKETLDPKRRINYAGIQGETQGEEGGTSNEEQRGKDSVDTSEGNVLDDGDMTIVTEARVSRLNMYSANMKKHNSQEKQKQKPSKEGGPVSKEKLESVVNAFTTSIKKRNATVSQEQHSTEEK